MQGRARRQGCSILGFRPFALSLSTPVLSEAEGLHTNGNLALNSPGHATDMADLCIACKYL
jgi:hypothetical protein